MESIRESYKTQKELLAEGGKNCIDAVGRSFFIEKNTNKQILLKKSYKDKHISVFFISVISFLIILFCSDNEKLTNLTNISISVLAAGIYYFFAEILCNIRLSISLNKTRIDLYKSIATDVNNIFVGITATENWSSNELSELKEQILKNNQDKDWYDETFGNYLHEVNGEFIYGNRRLDFVKISLKDFENQLEHIENLIDWCYTKDIDYIFEFSSSILYKIIKHIDKMPDEKPAPNTREDVFLKEPLCRLFEEDNMEMIENIRKFVNVYKNIDSSKSNNVFERFWIEYVKSHGKNIKHLKRLD